MGKCSKCNREVSPTIHRMGEYEVDFYASYTTKNDESGEKARVELVKLVCKDCL